MASGVAEESISHPSSAKRPRIEKRQFLPAWKTEFPWLTYDHTEGMRCQYCIDADCHDLKIDCSDTNTSRHYCIQMKI